MDNSSLARLFDELADLLELASESAFKARAYRSFAQRARETAEPLAKIAARGELRALPGMSSHVAEKIEEALKSGSFTALDRAREAVPEGVRAMIGVADLTTREIRTLWQAGIASPSELAYACEENRLVTLSGIAAKRQARVLAAVRARIPRAAGSPLGMALEAARRIKRALVKAGAREVEVAGEARRGEELVQRLVVLARGLGARRVAHVIEKCAELGAPKVDSSKDAATFVIEGLRVRVRAVADGDWTHALVTETGDDAHVAWLEARAQGKFKAICDRAIEEADVYRALGVAVVPPELRTGEVSRVPARLVEAKHVRGVFHVHTDWSDGTASILEMARAAASAGFRYVGISDHSQAASYAGGLDAKRLRDQADAIAIARRESKDCAILHGIEVDILADGSLDLDDDTLAPLDFVIASVHAKLSMSAKEMTARIVRAVSHPLVTILGHPTGRLLLGRKGYPFDVDEVARAAAANDTYLEINANSQRLDLSDVLVRQAAKLGAKFAIDPDAHADRGLDDTRLGVAVARRAGLAKEQVLNARSADDVIAMLAARKAVAFARLGRA